MKTSLLILLLSSLLMSVNAQIEVHTSDLDNFWTAFDSIQKTSSKSEQLEIVQNLYLNKPNDGLKRTMELTSSTTEDFQNYMLANIEMLENKRNYINSAFNQKKVIEERLTGFKKLYPEFKEGNVYFVVGVGMFGGNTAKSNVVIGSEVMSTENKEWAIPIVLHEFVHTQQELKASALLGQCLYEGSADFISEILLNEKLTEIYPSSYIAFGQQNKNEVWSKFKNYLFSDKIGEYYDWLYGSKGVEIEEMQMKDLGYYIGYAICLSYYQNSIDKKKAIKTIIESDFSDHDIARKFLLASRFLHKKDIKFIKLGKFGDISLPENKVEKVLYGYTLQNDEVRFMFTPPKFINPSDIKSVSVAGSFNGWNPNDKRYQLAMAESGYILKISKMEFANSTNLEFKFVINGTNWQSVPEKAVNVNEQNGNLQLLLTEE